MKSSDQRSFAPPGSVSGTRDGPRPLPKENLADPMEGFALQAFCAGFDHISLGAFKTLADAERAHINASRNQLSNLRTLWSRNPTGTAENNLFSQNVGTRRFRA